jgi:PAS domain S-box-containing protein
MSDIWITTDAAGFVLGCSPEALEMLGYSARGARGRELPNMFVRERPRLAELLQAAQGEPVEREAAFRPNDRKAVRVRFRIALAERMPGGAVTLLWTFALRWPIGMRLPAGVDRRQMIVLWRRDSMRCVFVPGDSQQRRLFVCGADDEVIHEELPTDVPAAFARAAELQKLAADGALRLD